MIFRPRFFVNVKLWLHSDMRIWAPSLAARGYQEYKSRGHLEIQQSNRAPLNWHGAQWARQLRPRCVETARARTQMQINQSINQSTLSTSLEHREVPISSKQPLRLLLHPVPTKHKCLLAAAREQPEQSHRNSTRNVNRPSPQHSSAPHYILISSTLPSVLSEVLTHPQLKHNSVLNSITSKTSCLHFTLLGQLITLPLLASGWSADHNQTAALMGRWPQGYKTLHTNWMAPTIFILKSFIRLLDRWDMRPKFEMSKSNKIFRFPRCWVYLLLVPWTPLNGDTKLTRWARTIMTVPGAKLCARDVSAPQSTTLLFPGNWQSTMWKIGKRNI